MRFMECLSIPTNAPEKKCADRTLRWSCEMGVGLGFRGVGLAFMLRA